MQLSPKPPISEIVDRLGFGVAQLRAAILGGGVWLADGAELLLISSVTQAVADEWSFSPLQRGTVVSIVFVGILAGNLLSGPIGDSLGRRQLIIWSYVGIFVWSMVSSLAVDFYSLSLTRLCVGFSFGIGQPAWNALGSEITPASWRIAMQSLSTCLFVTGEVYSAFLLIEDDPNMQKLDWRWLLRMGAIPSLIYIVFSSIYLLQSPCFLALQGQNAEARAVLERMRYDNGVEHVEIEFQAPEGDGFIHGQTSWELLARQARIVFGRHLFGSTIIVMYSCFVLNFAYYGCLYAFPQVLPSVRTAHPPAVELLIGALWEYPGLIGGYIVGMYMKRKPAMKLYLFATFASLMLFGLGCIRPAVDNIQEQDVAEAGASLILNMGYYGIKVFTNIGFCVVYQYSVEIYPTEARITGTAVNLAGGRVAGMVARRADGWTDRQCQPLRF
eukprot:TRINITY_DN22845_c0_g1_i2.p1 TRINITY_DN22845_c0_g1~~TRINITY_DN22845_c0_g1_i2.p1  ORF type:complete len:443 (+),score=74.83 TRINITY_DN22845_c0_g1_i2:99-1427(+)